MAAARIFLGVFCIAFVGGNRIPDRDLLKGNVVAIASKEVGVRELSGHNDGKRVEEYLASVGLHRGDPYCAAWVSFIFKQAGYSAPRTGWSPDLFPSKRLVKVPEPGDVFGIYFTDMGRIAHCGLVERTHSDWVYSIEANTDASGGREGGGVYRRMRHKRGISRFSNWRKAL